MPWGYRSKSSRFRLSSEAWIGIVIGLVAAAAFGAYTIATS
jgi:hypothetical protein